MTTHRRKKREVVEFQDIRDVPIINMQKPKFKRVEAKSEGQQNYLDTMREKVITLVCGPPGCGKTVCAAGLAIEMLRNEQVKKIYISRPLVQACGEKMGELPGDMNEKIGPYLIPVMEALEMFASKKEIQAWTEDGTLEIIPCAFLRGRSLHNAFVIVEEAQNLTFEQIKLILTRIGTSTKLTLNGDLKQTDLNRYQKGAFRDYFDILKDLEFVGFCKLGKADIFRSPFIASIIEKIEAFEEKESVQDRVVKGY